MTTADDNQDPISAASSGLRALGVAPQRRVETLGLLSALIDLADASGEVLLDTALMQTEERLGIDACLEGYEWLERLDIIRRTWSGWVIQNFGEHRGPVGMTEASLAVLQRHFEAEDDAPVGAIAPQPVAAGAPVVPLKSWRRRVPVIAASVAAGVAALAGATQLVPQAAVTTRNAAAHANQPASVIAGAPTSAATAATSAVATTAADGADTTVAAGASPAVTTTTSSTLLPSVRCIGDVPRDLASRTSLRTTPTTADTSGLLPCP